MARSSSSLSGLSQTTTRFGVFDEARTSPQPQIFWLFVVFTILYFFMSRSAAPKISEILKKRQDVIAGDLAVAESLQAEAEQARIAFEKSQNDARDAATGLILSKREELKVEIDSEYQKLSDILNAKADEAQIRIEAVKDKALGDVRDVATEVCLEIISKISGISLDNKVVSKIVADKTSGGES